MWENQRRLRDPITWIITYITDLYRKTLRGLIKRDGNRRARALGASLPATSGNEDNTLPDARLASSSCEPARLCDGSVEPASLPAAGGTDELEWEKPESESDLDLSSGDTHGAGQLDVWRTNHVFSVGIRVAELAVFWMSHNLPQMHFRPFVSRLSQHFPGMYGSFQHTHNFLRGFAVSIQACLSTCIASDLHVGAGAPYTIIVHPRHRYCEHSRF